MYCEIVKNILERFIEGELEEPLKKEIEKHIAECYSCKNELSLASKVPFMIRSVHSPELPNGIIHSVLERINKPSKWFFSYKHLLDIFSSRKILYTSAIPIVIIILILSIVHLRPNEEQVNEPEPMYISMYTKNIDNSDKTKALMKQKETPKKVVSKDNSYSQNRVNRALTNSKKSEINNDEVSLAVSHINIAMEILGSAVKGVQASTLAESERVLSITMDKSHDIIKALSEAQIEVVNSLKINLNFINQFQNMEENTQ
ncbi:MAG: zf-HC2 domain-containing protein [bacterium]